MKAPEHAAEGLARKVTITIELDREHDGRWIAEVLDRPGALAYGATRPAATAAVLRVLAGVLEQTGASR